MGKEKMTGNERLALTVGLIIGALSGGLMGVLGIILSPPTVYEARIFREENKPAVMRLYKSGSDGYLFENPNNPEHYISLEEFEEKRREEYKQRAGQNQ